LGSGLGLGSAGVLRVLGEHLVDHLALEEVLEQVGLVRPLEQEGGAGGWVGGRVGGRVGGGGRVGANPKVNPKKVTLTLTLP